MVETESGHNFGRLGALIKETPDLRRLAVLRLTGQFGDGMFQAALSGAILFNPERETDPFAVAAGFIVLLLPYSILGPFAGALLDRWDRRLVLMYANVLRAILIASTATALLFGIGEGTLLLLALAVVGVSRFVLAGVSAALPLVVRPSWLVPMNSVLATVASGFAGLGAATGVAAIALIGEGDVGSAVAVFGSACGSIIGAAAAIRFAPRRLGPATPETAPTTGAVVRAVASGLRTGALAVWRAPGVTTAMIGIGAHRIVFGANTLVMVLILREPNQGDAMPGGLVGFGVAIAATATGMLMAAIVAPFLIPRLGRSRTITVAVTSAFFVQIGLIATLSHQLLLVGAFLLGLAGQTIKLTGDAAMQIDIDDSRRGQVFALQDTVFNISFVLALVVTAASVPPDGRSHVVVVAFAGVYVLGLVAIAFNRRRTPS
ncbi:MFS transporter [Antrihabitans sp. YC2-6]|uniref:MFS transporter n=1 Tax=Antrihabitans sp. YC2-6 TaxID=2799498 RepID=UPI0018F74CAC|nr:MFS transporter [Antrihabitans sp. YC2-6]MBJ8346464.1 MFS transporter [Antrihabitans sp. YC2-6]